MARAEVKTYYIQEEDMDDFVEMLKGGEARCIPALYLDETDLGKKTVMMACWLYIRQKKLFEVDCCGFYTFNEDSLLPEYVHDVGPYFITECDGGFRGVDISDYGGKRRVRVIDTVPSCAVLDLGQVPIYEASE